MQDLLLSRWRTCCSMWHKLCTCDCHLIPRKLWYVVLPTISYRIATRTRRSPSDSTRPRTFCYGVHTRSTMIYCEIWPLTRSEWYFAVLSLFSHFYSPQFCLELGIDSYFLANFYLSSSSCTSGGNTATFSKAAPIVWHHLFASCDAFLCRYNNANVRMAARALINLYRQENPQLLHRKDRMRPTIAMQARVHVF